MTSSDAAPNRLLLETLEVPERLRHLLELELALASSSPSPHPHYRVHHHHPRSKQFYYSPHFNIAEKFKKFVEIKLCGEVSPASEFIVEEDIRISRL